MSTTIGLAHLPSSVAPRDRRLTKSLSSFAVSGAVCVSSGTLLYCYAESLSAWRSGIVIVHEVSGDVTAAFLVVYLVVHLARAWRMSAQRPVSWWSGLLAMVSWGVATVTGVIGQFTSLDASPALWWMHAIASFVAAASACFHVAKGFRAHYSHLEEVV
jgi:hypothetical protein